MQETVDAATQTADKVVNSAPQGGTWGMIGYVVIIFVIIYFFMVLPNKRRMAEYKKMLDGIKVGSRVMAAGIYGTVKEIKEKTIMLEIAKGVVIEINKNAVSSVE